VIKVEDRVDRVGWTVMLLI